MISKNKIITGQNASYTATTKYQKTKASKKISVNAVGNFGETELGLSSSLKGNKELKKPNKKRSIFRKLYKNSKINKEKLSTTSDDSKLSEPAQTTKAQIKPRNYHEMEIIKSKIEKDPNKLNELIEQILLNKRKPSDEITSKETKERNRGAFKKELGNVKILDKKPSKRNQKVEDRASTADNPRGITVKGRKTKKSTSLATLPFEKQCEKKIEELTTHLKTLPRPRVKPTLPTNIINLNEHEKSTINLKISKSNIKNSKSNRSKISKNNSAENPNQCFVIDCNKSNASSGKSSPTVSTNSTKRSKTQPPGWKLPKVSKLIIQNRQVPETDLEKLNLTVDDAIANRKTFTVCGGYRSIRNALESRGWVEKLNVYHSTFTDDVIKQLYKLPVVELLRGLHDKTTGDAHKRVILSKLLGRHQVDFYWDYNRDAYKQNSDNVKLTIINTIQRGVFNYANKRGLCECMKNAHWYHKPGFSNLRHPRCYSLMNNADPMDFIKDFKITACMSFLKWIMQTSRSKSCKLISEFGEIPIAAFQFAMRECTKFMKKLKHDDIDRNIPEASETEWNTFLDCYSTAVHIGNHFKGDAYETENTMVHKSKLVMAKLKKCWPYCDMDGIMNIWILKPANGSRGIGIHICRTLQYILKIISENRSCTYVIQKYIERPLLIFNTKFDIRQWFLISQTCPLTIWIYKDCYLRFSSQTYNLRKLHESIHLTNNSVQSRYSNSNNRDPGLPAYNMWDVKAFKAYLLKRGAPDLFDTVIYPGMKESILAAILLNQEHLTKRRNSFELHGADFMLTEDFKPWLIEINSRPALYGSTPVTARMCPRVLEDVIKVIIDNRQDPKARTGQFELLYREEIEKLPAVDTTSLLVEGQSIPTEYFQTPEQAIEEGNLYNSNKSSEILDITNNKAFIMQVGKEMKVTLQNLLDLIQNEKKRRQAMLSLYDRSTASRDESNNSVNSGRIEELTELFVRPTGEDDISTNSNVETDSMELGGVTYKDSANVGLLDSIKNDAKELQEMITMDLPISSNKDLDANSGRIVEVLQTIEKTKHVSASNTGLLQNILGLISSLSFSSRKKETKQLLW